LWHTCTRLGFSKPIVDEVYCQEVQNVYDIERRQ
jgi:hypothetical protein